MQCVPVHQNTFKPMLFARAVRTHSSKLLKFMLVAHAICTFLLKHSCIYVGFMCKMCLIIKTFLALCGLHIPYVIFILRCTWLHRSLRSVPTLRKDRIILKKIYKYPTFYVLYCFISPDPVAARSKVQACGRSPAEIVGPSPTGGMEVFLLCVVK